MAVSRTVLSVWQVGLNTINITIADFGDGGLAPSHICTGTGPTPCHIRSDTATVGPHCSAPQCLCAETGLSLSHARIHECVHVVQGSSTRPSS
jgi:hypothetical protein